MITPNVKDNVIIQPEITTNVAKIAIQYLSGWNTFHRFESGDKNSLQTLIYVPKIAQGCLIYSIRTKQPAHYIVYVFIHILKCTVCSETKATCGAIDLQHRL